MHNLMKWLKIVVALLLRSSKIFRCFQYFQYFENQNNLNMYILAKQKLNMVTELVAMFDVQNNK